MRQCIFCRKYKEEKEFNMEHIILESLGGKGKEDICINVCTSCNSALGTRVDACLANHEITKYMRYFLKIKGRNGVPNPFKKVKLKYADTPFTGELLLDKEGNLTGFRADHRTYEINGKTLIIGPRKGFAKYVNSQLKKNRIPLLPESEIVENALHIEKPKVPRLDKLEFPEDVKNNYLYFIFPTMLKMAYEFCFVKLGEKYLDDPLATEIRKFVMNFDCKKEKDYFCPTDAHLEWNDGQAKMVSLTIYKENSKLYVKINLYGEITCIVCMSEIADIYGEIEESTLRVEV